MIPFVKALGDEVEKAAAASEIFGSPEQLAATSVGCYDRADLSSG